MKTKLIILSLALLALAVVPTWAAHNGSLSLGLGLSMGPGGGGSTEHYFTTGYFASGYFY